MGLFENYTNVRIGVLVSFNKNSRSFVRTSKVVKKENGTRPDVQTTLDLVSSGGRVGGVRTRRRGTFSGEHFVCCPTLNTEGKWWSFMKYVHLFGLLLFHNFVSSFLFTCLPLLLNLSLRGSKSLVKTVNRKRRTSSSRRSNKEGQVKKVKS